MTSSPASASDLRFLDRPEGRIAYEVQGNGPLLLLVPGMGELRSSYRYLVSPLVAAGYRVVSADLRGHGDSDTTFSTYGDTATADDIVALVTELGGPAVIVGNSLAAGSAVMVAAEHPQLVSALVLIGPYVRNPKVNPLALAAFRAMTLPLWVASIWKGYMPTLYAGRKPDDFADYRARVHRSLARPAYGKALSRTIRMTDHAPAEAAVPGVKAPVLVIMGDRDPDFSDPAAEASWIGDALHASVVMVEQAGHYPQSQQPEVTFDAIAPFLASALNRA